MNPLLPTPDPSRIRHTAGDVSASVSARTNEVQMLVIDGCVASMGEFSHDELRLLAEYLEAGNADGWLPKLVREYLNVWREIGERP